MKNRAKSVITAAAALMLTVSASAVTSPVDYVNTLMGTDSKVSLSNGNTVPSVALPWGMNQWIPQTGKMGDGWAYTYGAHTIRGFKQTHQPSPWINDYGQFSIMPVRGKILNQLTDGEIDKLRASAEKLKDVIRQVEI